MSSLRNPALLIVLALMSSTLGLSTCDAGIINGGFESGLTGWTASGDVLTVDASIGTGPVEGTMQALLTTDTINGDAFNFSGTDAIPVADLEAALGARSGFAGWRL